MVRRFEKVYKPIQYNMETGIKENREIYKFEGVAGENIRIYRLHFLVYWCAHIYIYIYT